MKTGIKISLIIVALILSNIFYFYSKTASQENLINYLENKAHKYSRGFSNFQLQKTQKIGDHILIIFTYKNEKDNLNVLSHALFKKSYLNRYKFISAFGIDTMFKNHLIYNLNLDGDKYTILYGILNEDNKNYKVYVDYPSSEDCETEVIYDKGYYLRIFEGYVSIVPE